VKLGATHGVSVQNMCASMTGLTSEEYRDLLLAGGRSIEGNRYVGEEGDAQPHRQPQGGATKKTF
jgi:protocatechuate 4,5-dioxygenase, alpha chain